ncbi:MAG TPA: hypothetical protein VGO45_03440 [Bacteroidia bacterium]|jgi:hypothetical protein|nr:hypothetical protein [Bacteroidia bacterium]
MYFKKAVLPLNGILAAAFAVTLAACGSNNNVEQETAGAAKDSAQQKTTAPKTEQTTFALPSPLQIASIFKKAGLKYFPNLANPVENSGKYNSGKISEALNLGVYSADLSYCTLNKQNQDSKNYMKASRDLATLLGLGKVFETDNLATRFEKNLGSEDSLAAIIAEMQMQTDMVLEENEQEYVSATVFAGAWIESMYIGGKVYEKAKEKNVSSRLIEQMSIAENIIKALKAQEQKDPNLTAVIADLVAIRDIYKGFAGVKALSENTSEDVDFSKIPMTEEEISSLTKKIVEVRTKIVKG